LPFFSFLFTIKAAPAATTAQVSHEMPLNTEHYGCRRGFDVRPGEQRVEIKTPLETSGASTESDAETQEQMVFRTVQGCLVFDVRRNVVATIR